MRKKRSTLLPILGVMIVAIAGFMALRIPAHATQGNHQTWVCHPVNGNGETGYGWNLIKPDHASSHIDEALYPNGHYWKHETQDGRHDVYAVDGHCPGWTPPTTETPTPTPTVTPTEEPTETPSETPTENPSETPTQTPSTTPSVPQTPTTTPTLIPPTHTSVPQVKHRDVHKSNCTENFILHQHKGQDGQWVTDSKEITATGVFCGPTVVEEGF